MNAIETALLADVSSATTIVGTLVVAGLGIFIVLWAVRLFKRGVRAGA